MYRNDQQNNFSLFIVEASRRRLFKTDKLHRVPGCWTGHSHKLYMLFGNQKLYKMDIGPDVIQGGYHSDERGNLFFFNEFDLLPVKRFYAIEHPNTEVVRAWQAHKIEQKWFYVISGAFKIVLVQPDNWDDPSGNLETREFILDDGCNMVLHVPGNFANGFKALEINSKIIIFSNFTTDESSNDNFRFDSKMWYDWG